MAVTLQRNTLKEYELAHSPGKGGCNYIHLILLQCMTLSRHQEHLVHQFLQLVLSALSHPVGQRI